MKLTVWGIFALAVAAGACTRSGGGPRDWYDPNAPLTGVHEHVTTCDPAWGLQGDPPTYPTWCEAGCAVKPTLADTSVNCEGVNPHYPNGYECLATIVVDGVRGCCMKNADIAVEFFECL